MQKKNCNGSTNDNRQTKAKINELSKTSHAELDMWLTFQRTELHLLGDLWIWKSSSRSQMEAVQSS